MSSIGTGYDLSASQFSPDGRVFQVEYANKAVENSGTAIGIRGKDGVVFGVEKLVTSKLYETGANKRIFNIDKHIGMAVAGLLADARQVVETSREESSNYKSNYGSPIPLKHLTDRVSMFVHAYTLYSSVRPFGVSCLLGSYDADGPQLYVIDPSGVSFGYLGCAIGKAKQAAKTEIEKIKMKDMLCVDLVKEVAKIIMPKLKRKSGTQRSSSNRLGMTFRRVARDEILDGGVPGSSLVHPAESGLGADKQMEVKAHLYKPFRPSVLGADKQMEVKAHLFKPSGPSVLYTSLDCLPCSSAESLLENKPHILPECMLDNAHGSPIDTEYTHHTVQQPRFDSISFDQIKPTEQSNDFMFIATPITMNPFGSKNFIRGSFHQGDDIFSPQSRGSQCVAISLCALIYGQNTVMDSQAMLDNVLIEGDTLYKKIISELHGKGMLQSNLLSFEEIPSEVNVFNTNLYVLKSDVISGIAVQQCETSNLPTLHQSLYLALQISNQMLVIIRGLCSAVYITTEQYHFFDSHSHGQDGLSAPGGTSIFLSFDCLEDLVAYMYVFYGTMNIDMCTQFDILPLHFTMMDSGVHTHNEGLCPTVISDWKTVSCKKYRRNGSHSPDISADQTNLLDNYFQDQESKALRKHTSDIDRHSSKDKRSYMKTYMRKRRQDPLIRAKEKNRELKSKRKARKDPLIRTKEKNQELQNKRKARKDPIVKSAEKMKRQELRQDPLIRAKEKNRELESKRKARKDPLIRRKEKNRELQNKRKARKDPIVKSAEKMKRQELRQDPLIRAKEKNRELESKRKARKDPLIRRKEKNQELQNKRKARKDPIVKSAEKTKRQELRQDPLIRAKEKNQELESKRKARKDPIVKSAEKTKRQELRQDPLIRAKEKNQELESKRKARKDPIVKSAEKTKRQELRQDPLIRAKEKNRELESKRKARKDPLIRTKEKNQELESKRKARKDPIVKSAEKMKRRILREDPLIRNHEAELELKSKQKKRNNAYYKAIACEKKRLSRSFISFRIQEKSRENQSLREKRKKANFQANEKNLREARKYGSELNECISKFKQTISTGPVYVCTCCHQTWFKHSVESASTVANHLDRSFVQQHFTKYLSVDDKEWICKSCSNNLKKNKTPSLSVANKNTFPIKPKELELHQLEERLVALRIPFMQIRELPRGGQLSVKGNVVNVPVDIQPVIESLPRAFDTQVTVPVRLKKKLSYKKCDFTENVRPLQVVSALHWLMNHSDLYKNSGIHIDENWLQNTTENCSETVQEFFGRTNMDEFPPTDDVTQTTENVTSKNENDYESDHFSEIDENEKVVGNSDTIIDSADPTTDTIYTFAPGEGQIPISLYQDTNAEYLSFPSIFCGQKRPENEDRSVPVHYSDICKMELRHVDRRVASNVPNVFFKMKKLQLKQVSDKVHLALRRCKTEGKKLTVSQVLRPECRENLVNLDEGFYIFRTLRSSPPYLEARKKDVFAMIRQLGLPTWFTSLSSADTRWVDLLKILAKLNSGKTLNDDNVAKMTWADKTKLVQTDPVTCVRYFDHRVQEFIGTVLKSNHEPLGKVKDYFYRVEFQQRGSPHIHMLLWIEDAPQYETHTDEEVVSFIEQYVSCSNIDDPLVDFQVHKHSRSCRKKEKAICRFGFPIPPMKKTVILEPLIADQADTKKYKELFVSIQQKLNEIKEYDLSFEQFLKQLNTDDEDYLKAVQSSLDGPKVFLKRNLAEVRINAYMKPILRAWGANHDLQFVLDPYGCAVYIVSYISKAQRGMSILMNEACKEARKGNMDLKKQVRHIGNKFLNSVEISAQEACYLVLQLPMTKATRDVVFINTSPPDKRTFLLKSRETLEKMAENSTEIEADNIIKRYSKRPKQLEHWCLADYVSQLEIIYPASDDMFHEENEHNDDERNEPEEIHPDMLVEEGIQITLKSGIRIKSRKNPKVLRYVRYSLKVDPENYYREKLLLFHPWRNESEDVLGAHNSYEDHYFALKNFIDFKVKEYEKNVDQLNEAMKRAADDLNFDEIAPSNEQRESDDLQTGSVASEQFVYFDPDRPEVQRQYDLGNDIGSSVALVNITVNTKRMSDANYRSLVHSLNRKQHEFFQHVLQSVKQNLEPLHVFLSGGAGVGKSVVVSALHEALLRHLSTSAGDNPDVCKVLLCAPTGKAAFHISGMTIHLAFRIPASQGYCIKPLDSDTLNTLRTIYRDLAVVMIDEVSMVGHNMLMLINHRLQQIKGSTLFFGGVHMILIGDLFQLKPVMDGWIFENLKNNFGPLATNLWQELFAMHELDEIMRQKDDKEFAEILNRLREGKHQQSDIEVLKKREIKTTNPNYPKNAIHLFSTNASVDSFNKEAFQLSPSIKTVTTALDTVIGDDTKSVKEQLISRLPNDASKTAGLQKKLGIAVGMTYDLCANVDVNDGLANGSSCCIKFIESKQQNTNRPSIVWVKFYDQNVGSEWRAKYRHLYHIGIDPSWTPIFDIKRNFVYFRKTFLRIQFPLRQSAAKTIHKSQGDTLNEVVIDMSGTRIFSHAHYVAISRAKTLQGLNILNLNETKISVSEKVKQELTRLRNEQVLALCYIPLYQIQDTLAKLVFLNTRSLKSHKDDIFQEPNVQDANMICLVETWLTAEDEMHTLNVPGYQLFRADGYQSENTRPHRGIALYFKEGIPVVQNKTLIQQDFEIVLTELLFDMRRVIVVTLYRSPSCSISSLKKHLLEFVSPVTYNTEFVIQGDFNSDILQEHTVSAFIEEQFHCKQVVQKATHDSGSLIDHVYSNIESIKNEVIECVWSDHALVYSAIAR